jgi:hypothetical protein
MTPPAYRLPAERPHPNEPPLEPIADRELLPVFALLWVASVVRVALAARCDETFGAEATLALFATATIPLLLRGNLANLSHRLWRRRP